MSLTELCIEVSTRTKMGKGPNKRLRRKGLIPCVLYGHGIEPLAIAAELKQVQRIAHHPSIINLNLEDTKDTRNVLIKDLQFDYRGSTIIHVDFQEVKMDEVITAEIPLEVVGDPVGLQQGGQLDQIIHGIEVHCLPKDLPEKIVYDVSNMGLGDSVSVSDLPYPEGVKGSFSDPHTVAIHVILPRLAQEETEEGEKEESKVAKQGGEPEVISKGKKEEAE